MSAPGTGGTTLDGNTLAGVLSEIFTAEMTAALGQCAGCLRRGPLADTVLYTRAPGLVARCRGCGAVLLRVVQDSTRIWLDLRGLHCLQITTGPVAVAEDFS